MTTVQCSLRFMWQTLWKI